MGDSTEPMRAGIDEFRSAAERHAIRLEGMFGRRGIEPLRSSSPSHPAIRQIDLLKQFAATGVLPYGTELETLGEIAAMQIDQRM